MYICFIFNFINISDNSLFWKIIIIKAENYFKYFFQNKIIRIFNIL